MKSIFGRLSAVFAVVCLALAASPAIAQNTTVSASLVGGTTNPAANATIYWQPVSAARVGTSGGQMLGTPYSSVITSGAFSKSMPDALSSYPNICYAVTVIDNVTLNVLLGAGLTQDGTHVNLGGVYGCVQPTGSTWSFDTYVPPATPPTIYAPVAGPTGPAGANGTNCASGSSPSTCDFNGTLESTASVVGSSTPNMANQITASVVNGDISCPPSVSLNTCLDVAKTFVTTNDSGSAHSVKVLLQDGTYSLTGPYALISGMTIEGVKPRVIDAGYVFVSDAVPNGGSWIDCGGATCFSQTGTYTDSLTDINLRNLGFTNWGSAIAIFGGSSLGGVTGASIEHIVGHGQSTLNASDQGFVFYNSLFFPMDDITLTNVNTGLAIYFDSPGGITPGNTVISSFFEQTYPKTVANGNNTEPGIVIATKSGTTGTINMVTLVRPQINSSGSDSSADGIVLNGGNSIGIYDADVEGLMANGIRLINTSESHIGVVEEWGQTCGVNLDATSLDNVVESTTAGASGCIDPAAQYQNTFIGSFGGFTGAQPGGLVTGGQGSASYANPLITPISNTQSMIRTLPVVASPGSNDTVAIGSVLGNGGGAYEEVTVTITGTAGYASSKKYLIPWVYNGTSGAVQKVSPIVTTGPYSGNDFDLDVSVSSGTFSLWLVRTSGTTAANASVEWKHYSSYGDTVSGGMFSPTWDTFTPSTTVSTTTAASTIYALSLPPSGGSSVSSAYASGDLTTTTSLGCCSSTSSLWTAPSTGYYDINVSATVTTAGTGGTFETQVECSAANAVSGTSNNLATVGSSSSAELLCRMTTGQYFYYSVPFSGPTGSPTVTYALHVLQVP